MPARATGYVVTHYGAGRMSVKDIQSAIAALPPPELAKLMAWLEEPYARACDRQVADDLDAGRLDQVLAAAEKEYQAGLAKPLLCT